MDKEGTLIAGRYELAARAGEGGMATVWKAIARGAAGFERTVALKRILGGLAADPEFVRMFVEEARVGSQLLHPNIVPVLDFGEDADGYYLVMDWVEGVDLGAWTEHFTRNARPTPWQLVAGIGIEMLKGLSAAHSRLDHHGALAPVIHRDVDPKNVLLSVQGIVRLTDFGLARAMDRARMTAPGMVKGKVRYLPPETFDGVTANERGDLYSTGVVLWETFAGQRLFEGRNDTESLLAVRAGKVPPLASVRPDVPATLAAIVHRVMSSHPAARFGAADEMARAIADVLRAEGGRSDAASLAQTVIDARRARRAENKAGVPLVGVAARAVRAEAERAPSDPPILLTKKKDA